MASLLQQRERLVERLRELGEGEFADAVLAQGDDNRAVSEAGGDWIDKFMAAHAATLAHALWLTFAIGQAGVAINYDHPAARKMVAQLAHDVDDLEKSQVDLMVVLRDMVANAQRNLEKQ